MDRPLYPAGGRAKALTRSPLLFRPGAGDTELLRGLRLDRSHCSALALKRPRSGADEFGMFLRHDEPILLTEGGIVGLCVSLNRPLVELDNLPAGPARAAIALHRDDSGERALVVAIRSEASSAVIRFAFRGQLNSEAGRAMEVGLQFAEGMGFLFDEDILAGNLPAAERKALETWCELTCDELPRQRPVSARQPAATAGSADEVLVLDDVIDRRDDLPPLDAQATRQVLSKFRRPADPRSAKVVVLEDAGGVPAQLGRISIVRRRKDEGEPTGTEASARLARLLARF